MEGNVREATRGKREESGRKTRGKRGKGKRRKEKKKNRLSFFQTRSSFLTKKNFSFSSLPEVN
jgi:hypothetical protein